MTDRNPLEAFKAPTQLKLTALWVATMFCYVYGDYFALYRPGRMEAMNKGMMGPLGEATPTVLLAVSASMIVPSLMVMLSLALKPVVGRWLNVAVGLAYTAIVILTMKNAQPYYLLFGTVDAALTLAVVWTALRWPRTALA